MNCRNLDESLVRQAKAAAAVRGISLGELVELALERELANAEGPRRKPAWAAMLDDQRRLARAQDHLPSGVRR